MAMNAENNNQEKITALYCRLSVEDIKDDKDKKRKGQEDESNSISNQKQILSDYAKKHGYTNTMFFVDDGISGTSFDRNDFNRMHRMVEEGKIGTIIVKDLSRFGREHIEGGRLARTVVPHDAHRLAGRDNERDVAQHGLRAIREGYIADFKHLRKTL